MARQPLQCKAMCCALHEPMCKCVCHIVHMLSKICVSLPSDKACGKLFFRDINSTLHFYKNAHRPPFLSLLAVKKSKPMDDT